METSMVYRNLNGKESFEGTVNGMKFTTRDAYDKAVAEAQKLEAQNTLESKKALIESNKACNCNAVNENLLNSLMSLTRVRDTKDVSVEFDLETFKESLKEKTANVSALLAKADCKTKEAFVECLITSVDRAIRIIKDYNALLDIVVNFISIYEKANSYDKTVKSKEVLRLLNQVFTLTSTDVSQSAETFKTLSAVINKRIQYCDIVGAFLDELIDEAKRQETCKCSECEKEPAEKEPVEKDELGDFFDSMKSIFNSLR